MLQSVDIFFDVPPYKQYNLQLVTLSQHHDSSVISRFTLQLNCLDTYRVFIFFYTGYNLCSRIQMEILVLLKQQICQDPLRKLHLYVALKNIELFY